MQIGLLRLLEILNSDTMKTLIYFKKTVILIIFSLSIISCGKIDNPDNKNNSLTKGVTLNFTTSSIIHNSVITREAYMSEINDLNVFIYDENGILYQHFYIPELSNSPTFICSLKKIYVYAVANWGNNMYSYNISYSSNLEDINLQFNESSLLGIRNVLTCKSELIDLYDGINIDVELQRSFAKLTVCFDKSELNEGVNVSVDKIEIKNSPNYTPLFKPFNATQNSEIITNGDYIISPAIYTEHDLAQPIILAENLQGELLPYNNIQSQKVLSQSMGALCTYVEITASYSSNEKTGSVKYRIYLGKNETTNFDIKRNTWYKLTVKFKGNTLNESSWRLVTDDLKDLVKEIDITPEILEFNTLNSSSQISTSIIPESAYNKTVTWTSTNPLIATVDYSGNVTAKGYGSCRIIAFTNDGSNLSDTTLVNVIYYNPVKLVSDIILSPSNIYFTFMENQTQQIFANVLPIDANNKNLTWQSSNNLVATVNQNGEVTQTGIGNCIISATAQDGSNISVTIPVYVNYAQATGIEIVEDYNQITGVTIPAKEVLTDARFCDGIRGINLYKIKVIPANANQNVNTDWSLLRVNNDPSRMATLIKNSDQSATLSAKDIENVYTNRGMVIISASASGFTSSKTIQIFEKIPLRFEWGTWIVPGEETEVEGIVPRYSFHNTIVAPYELPSIAIVSSSGIEYWGAQLGQVWVNPLLPSNYNDYLYEFSQAIIHPAGEYYLENNCFYTIEH